MCWLAVGFTDWSDCIDIPNFDLYSAEALGQNVVDGSENNEEDETKDAHKNRHHAVDDPHYSDAGGVAKDNHWDADESVDKAKEKCTLPSLFCSIARPRFG